MKDFIRIGGEIISAPLNENFRRLRNDISISNTNLVFNDTFGVQNTVGEMYALIDDPTVELVEGQVCYVISSGELYRYSNHDYDWHKIADFGQTFRQAFLNSGVVALQQISSSEKSYITKKDEHTLTIPAMLVYFKTLPGNQDYLKGMYKIEETDLDVSSKLNSPGVYSIYANGAEIALQQINNNNIYIIGEGMPQQDDPEKIYMGGFMINNEHTIIDTFIYTIPDIAYTADRGFFYLTGGQVKGGYLQPSSPSANLVMGVAGIYYDEGINAPQSEIDDYPIDAYGGSNYNIRIIGTEGAETGLSKLIYLYPEEPLEHGFVDTEGALIYNKYYNENTGTLDAVAPGQFTIQRHLITPCGHDCTDIILYGKRIYNSLTDALSNINKPETLNLDFPYVEVTRIIVGCPLLGREFVTDDPELCNFSTLERLSQIGNFEPKFADNAFMIYSGDIQDPDPSYFRFNLAELQAQQYNNEYNLYLLPFDTIRYDFSLPTKYITDTSNPSVTMTHADTRTVTTGSTTKEGYELADIKDIDALRTRVNNIESEIWHIYDSTKSNIYEQSVRYRLFHLEDRATHLETRMTQAETDITTLYKTKVHKNTTINGYKLGDDLNSTVEAKSFNLATGDIAEGQGKGSTTNLWYTDTRVNANSHVTTAYNHANKTGSGTVSNTNPHGLNFDNITDGTNYHAVSTAQQSKINNLPANTNQELQNLNNTKISSIAIKKVDGNSSTTTGTVTDLGNVKTLRFYDVGTDITVAGDVATIECVGQIDSSVVMFKNEYASLSLLDPVTYSGTVDKASQAFTANHINGITEAGNNKYYGTNASGTPGTYSLPVYVSSADASAYATIDDVTFQPINKSVRLAHLGDSTVTYTSADEEYILGTNLHDLVVNHYHKAYDSSVLKSAEINEWNFGDNLSVTINGHRATINASGGGGTGATSFQGLTDVNVTYSLDNVGKTVVLTNIGTDASPNYKLGFANVPSFDSYMLKSTYVSTTNPLYVKFAERATTATNANSATTALTLQNSYTVSDSSTGNTSLWSANKIINYVGTQVNTGVKTYSGTTVPSASLGKDGDIYILLAS